jgi:hypothetical protein
LPITHLNRAKIKIAPTQRAFKINFLIGAPFVGQPSNKQQAGTSFNQTTSTEVHLTANRAIACKS